MRNLKKFLALVLAMMMVFSLMVTANAATTAADLNKAYDTLELYGIFQGVANNDPATDRNFTRAQMAMVAYRLATGDTEGKQLDLYKGYSARFSDVPEDEWYAGAVGFCANYGIVVGYPDRTFLPDRPVTGVQAAAMLLRLLGYDANGEFTGTNWDYRVLGQAERDGILTGLEVDSLYGTASRGLAAYLTLNAATIPVQVSYSTTTSRYIPTGKGELLLVSKPTETSAQDEFGAYNYKSTYTVTFNWNNWENTVLTITDTNNALLMTTFYGPMTECDLADLIGVKTYATLTSYTNGIGNKGSVTIEAVDTVNWIGAQGRETSVYDKDNDGVGDTIVFKDVVLAAIDGAAGDIIDTGAHTIKSNAMGTWVFGNNVMEGKPTASAGKNNNNVSSPSTTYYVASTSASTYTVKDDNYVEGELIYAYILTGTTNNEINGTGVPYDPATGKAYTTVPNRLVDGERVLTKEVTVNAIEYDSNRNIVGFWDTNNVLYLYSVSFGYNAADPAFVNYFVNGGASASVQVLQNNDIKKTYNVYYWVDGDNNNDVLGIEPVTEPAQYGVVIGEEAVALNGASLINSYGVQYTVLLEDGSVKQFIGVQGNTAAGYAYGYGQLAASNTNGVSKIRKLVKIEQNTFNPYYTVTAATTDVSPNNNMVGNTFYADKADTLNDAANAWVTPTGAVLVNDNTKIFVANYVMNNANNVQGAYSVDSSNPYTIYSGFQALDFDMRYRDGAGNANKIYENGELVLGYNTAGAYVANSITNLDVYAFDAYGNEIKNYTDWDTAAYVLVLNGTEKVPIAEREQKVSNYAYVVNALNQATVYDEFYRFQVYKNGVKSTLDLNNVSGHNVTTSGSGLYIYRDDSTNGYSSTVGPVNKISNWTYGAGVLKGTTTYGPSNNGVAGISRTGWNTVYGTNTTYLTVAEGVKICIVNDSTGEIFDTNYTLRTLGQYYDELYYQVDGYGRITFIYVVDKDHNNTPGSTGISAVTIDWDDGATSVPTAVGDPVSVYAVTTSSTNLYTVSGVWQKLNTRTGYWENYSADVFIAGDYRMVITVTAKSNSYFAVGFDPKANVTWASGLSAGYPTTAADALTSTASSITLYSATINIPAS